MQLHQMRPRALEHVLGLPSTIICLRGAAVAVAVTTAQCYESCPRGKAVVL